MKFYYALLPVFLFFHCKNGPISPKTWQVGVCTIAINPAMGAFIAGDKHNRHFTAVHDSLYVKAIVLADTNNQMALLTFDCIGLLYPTLLEIRKAVSKKIPAAEFDPSSIVMASSHTHSGPDVVGIWGPDPLTSGVDSVYMKNLVYAATEAIARAWGSKQAATMHVAETTFGEAWVHNISEPNELDRAVSIVQFKDKSGKSMATLTNFACHPTILDGTLTIVSADYVYGMYQHLNETLGGTNFFLQGSIGGWVQPEYEKKTMEVAEKRGRDLGLVVENALKQASSSTVPPRIQYKHKVIQLPVQNEGFQQLAAAGVIKRTITDSVATEIASFSWGNTQFITHPGETVPAYSLQSKAWMTNQGPKFVIGLGMDALGYILKPSFFDPAANIPHCEYLTGMSVGRDAGPILMKAVEELLKEQ